MPDADVYLNSRQVRARYGDVSAMWIERRLHNDPAFPRPDYFGSQRRFWKLSKLEAYERACATRGSMPYARLLAEVAAARTKAEALAIIEKHRTCTWWRDLSPRDREQIEEQLADLVAEKPE